MRQFARFLVAGGLSTFTHVVSATAIIEFISFNPVAANGVAFILATTVSYWLNTKWSFNLNSTKQIFVRYVSVVTAGLLLTTLITGTVDMYGGPYLLGILCVVCTVPFVTYFLHRYWTYR